MKSVREMDTATLKREWDALRRKVVRQSEGERSREDLDTLLAMRKEIDRRELGSRPKVEVDFEKYLTD